MKDKKMEPAKFTMYIPAVLNNQVEFLRYQERISKNKIVLEALREYLPKRMKNYPEYKELKSE
ncbi:MAG: hypothetical protein ACYDIA_14105 [Candidatus Humimicrobiaceae bacterium]